LGAAAAIHRRDAAAATESEAPPEAAEEDPMNIHDLRLATIAIAQTLEMASDHLLGQRLRSLPDPTNPHAIAIWHEQLRAMATVAVERCVGARRRMDDAHQHAQLFSVASTDHHRWKRVVLALDEWGKFVVEHLQDPATSAEVAA
jgi:hypothetical protein